MFVVRVRREEGDYFRMAKGQTISILYRWRRVLREKRQKTREKESSLQQTAILETALASAARRVGSLPSGAHDQKDSESANLPLDLNFIIIIIF